MLQIARRCLKKLPIAVVRYLSYFKQISSW
jgi:hypothetical protein